MLINGVETFVVFKQDIICKPGEDAPFKIIIAECIAYDTVICKYQSDSIPWLVDHPDTVDLDIVCIFNVDAICCDRIRCIDDSTISEGDENNRVRGGPGSAEIKSCIVAISNPDRITSIDLIGCILECAPGLGPGVS